MGKDGERQLTSAWYLPGTEHCARHIVGILPHFILRTTLWPYGYYSLFAELQKSLKNCAVP